MPTHRSKLRQKETSKQTTKATSSSKLITAKLEQIKLDNTWAPTDQSKVKQYKTTSRECLPETEEKQIPHPLKIFDTE